MVVFLFLLPNVAKNETLTNTLALKTQEFELERIAKENKINQLSIALTHKAESLVGTKQGQCVIAVRNFLGVDRSQIHGYVQVQINSTSPQVGNIIVLVGKSRHSGVVLFTTPTRVVYYDSNGSLNQKAAIREIDVTSKLIKGYRDTGVLGL